MSLEDRTGAEFFKRRRARTVEEDGPIFEPYVGGKSRFMGRYKKNGVVYITVIGGPGRVDLDEYRIG